jgi:crotonobetainyl-CoA:carnitine CoA-transferase CaiB-like acyl-CoA transferase
MAPLRGIRALEVSLGLSTVGAGLAVSLPGSLLRDFGAQVTRVQSARRSTLDAGVEFATPWNRGKEVLDFDDAQDAAAAVFSRARDCDVLILAGSERLVEQAGLEYRELSRVNPRLIVVRIRPSRNALGAQPDLELLVQARAGVPTQIMAHRPGPAFGDLSIASAGAGLSATVGALAGLYARESTGLGGWAETSLYEGVQAMLPMITGRVEHYSPSTTLLWKNQGPPEALCYQCADGGYVQIWFGAKGAYEEFLAHMGDTPSEAGYNADLAGGAMVERGKRWAQRFATRDRAWWLADLAGHNFRCEPAWLPGEALGDPHVREVGLTVEHRSAERGPVTVLGPVVTVTPSGPGGPTPGHDVRDGHDAPGAGPLAGVRLLDLSAYLAGPVGTLVLAELGADVVKVEPPAGDVHRRMQPMFAAGQRGKRAMAVDLKSADAPDVLGRLFGWADVVHQNARLGLAERLGYDEASVRAVNPDVVYSFASGFGTHGPRALLAANDQLMQAIAGIEAAQGGAGQPPTYLRWGTVDVTGGWISACGMLAALYARKRGGGGQSVASSLLGAALTLKSGTFLAGDPVVSETVVSETVVSEPEASGTEASGTVVGGPVLDAGQTGYGAAYRIYQGGDGAWFALAVPDAAAWLRLRQAVARDDLPPAPPPLRTRPGGPQPAELALQEAFLAREAASWVRELGAAGVPAEPVDDVSRAEFAARFLDDPVNREMRRVATYQWDDLGQVEQPRFPPRYGPPRSGQPAPSPGASGIAGLGEHTAEILAQLGYDERQRAALAKSGTVGGPAQTVTSPDNAAETNSRS